MFSRKKRPERIGLSLHKDLTPHVAEKSAELGMNPNEFVNACVEECIEAMLAKRDPGPGTPGLVTRYRDQTGRNELPKSYKLNSANYAMMRTLDAVLYDLNLAKECLYTGSDMGAIMTPAVVELLQKYMEKRTLLIGQASMSGKPYPAPFTEM